MYIYGICRCVAYGYVQPIYFLSLSRPDPVSGIDESGRDQDFLVYPVLFLYRHHIELLIKQIIGLALALAEEPDKYQYKKDNHNLNTLWPLAQKLILEVDGSYRTSDLKIVKEVVKALHQADERATDFRYARRNDGTRSLEGIHYVNTRRFGEKMGEASDLLDGVDNGLRYHNSGTAAKLLAYPLL